MTSTQNQNASLRNPVERLSDCRAKSAKEQAKQEIYTKLSSLQFCSFLSFFQAGSCHVEMKWDVHRTCSYFPMRKTSAVHNLCIL